MKRRLARERPRSTRSRLLATVGAVLASGAGAIAFEPGCSIGAGSGGVRGTLNVDTCWSGPFDLNPDFFAAVEYHGGLQIRIQNGGDFQTFSDGLSILVDSISATRSHLGKALDVDLPPSVVPPGIPIRAVTDPAPVHVALYLERSCKTQNAALFAVRDVRLAPDGGPNPEPFNPLDCGDAGASATQAPLGHSSIVFDDIFNGIVEEPKASERRTRGHFELYLADPRDVCPGRMDQPPPSRGKLDGEFDFYFERGRPGQPFP